MKVIIARHAQTDDNLNKVEIGQWAEVLLNKEGIMQAKKLANFLKDEKINFTYVSPQKRAVDTAQEVLKYHPSAKIVHTPYLKEQNLGIYEGIGKNEWKEIKKNSKEPFHLFRPQGGESYVDLQNRAKTFFNELIKKHENDTVLIVSHRGTIGMLLLDILEKPITKENYETHKPENAALTMVEIFKDKPPQIHFLNDTRHLS